MIPNRVISFFAVTLISFGSLSAQAAEPNACKGLEQNQCGSNSACNWIDPYKRSDGKQVNGYCRAKPADRSGQAKTATKAKSG